MYIYIYMYVPYITEYIVVSINTQNIMYMLTKPKKTTSAAQGGGGSFKNRKPLGEVGCCESRMAERIH